MNSANVNVPQEADGVASSVEEAEVFLQCKRFFIFYKVQCLVGKHVFSCREGWGEDTHVSLYTDKRTLTIGGSITVWLTNCFTGLDLNNISKAAESKQNK